MAMTATAKHPSLDELLTQIKDDPMTDVTTTIASLIRTALSRSEPPIPTNAPWGMDAYTVVYNKHWCSPEFATWFLTEMETVLAIALPTWGDDVHGLLKRLRFLKFMFPLVDGEDEQLVAVIDAVKDWSAKKAEGVHLDIVEHQRKFRDERKKMCASVKALAAYAKRKREEDDEKDKEEIVVVDPAILTRAKEAREARVKQGVVEEILKRYIVSDDNRAFIVQHFDVDCRVSVSATRGKKKHRINLTIGIYSSFQGAAIQQRTILQIATEIATRMQLVVRGP